VVDLQRARVTVMGARRVARKQTAVNSIEVTSFRDQTRRGHVFLALQCVGRKVSRNFEALGGDEKESRGKGWMPPLEFRHLDST